jgi:hypothetical protein
MQKVVKEKVLSVRNYAGSNLHTKEQTICISSKDQRHVKNLSTGFTFWTQCTILTYYKRVVEERASLKGLFLEHRNCKRNFIKEVVVPPKGTVLADVKPIEYEIKPKKKKAFSTQEHLLKSGSIAFIDGKVVQPVKLNLK